MRQLVPTASSTQRAAVGRVCMSEFVREMATPAGVWRERALAGARDGCALAGTFADDAFGVEQPHHVAVYVQHRPPDRPAFCETHDERRGPVHGVMRKCDAEVLVVRALDAVRALPHQDPTPWAVRWRLRDHRHVAVVDGAAGPVVHEHPHLDRWHVATIRNLTHVHARLALPACMRV